MFIFREEYYLARAEPMRRPEDNDDKFNDRYARWQQRLEETNGLSEVILAKQRHGPIGKVVLRFEAETTRFENFAGSETMPASDY
jgi:replicative DNA helicase